MKRIAIVYLLLFIYIGVFAQPNKMSYQAVVRNATGQLIANGNVGIRLQILQGSEFGAAVFVETHLTSTNANGLATFEIGGGTNVLGSIANIDWSNGPYFLKTESDLNGGTNYTISGTSQMLSVPYALFAGSGLKGDKGDPGAMGAKGDKGEKGDQGIVGPKGDKGDPGADGLKGEKGDRGDEGPVGPKGDKGEKGDIGLTGLKGDKGDTGMEGQKGDKGDPGAVGPKGEKGDQGNTGPPGSANINGTAGYIIKFSGSTTGDNSIMRQENGNININNPAGTVGKLNVKGASGGYGIHGESEFIGVFGDGSIGIYGNGISGIGVKGVGVVGVRGEGTSGEGVRASSESGDGISGISNSGDGVSGVSTSGLGVRGTSANSDGVFGISTSGAGGRFNSTSGTGIVIGVSNSQQALLAVSGDLILLTGQIGIGVADPTFRLHLPNTNTNIGGVGRAFNWTVYSDKRIKSDIKEIRYGLKEILQVRPKSYFQHDSEFEDGKLKLKEAGSQNIGFIAQEIYDVIPEMVSKPLNEADELWGLSYERLIPVLVKAIQEQQEYIESLKSKLANQTVSINKILKMQLELKDEIDTLKEKNIKTTSFKKF
ncbi:MAG: tail fiber domain-containing protein [Saprospiraceae bacterium]|nr:tail fiber domain-containing protein [Candidatus Vicinibacter proximus]